MIIQYISIFIEAIVAIIGLLIVINKKKIYGWGIFLTFGIYVFYDIARLVELNIPETILYISFFIASISALWVVFTIYKGAK